MKIHEFSIIAARPAHENDDFDRRFYDGGGDDATVSLQRGHLIIDFARAAESLETAIATAIADVQKAGAVVERIEPDPLVSLSEIAARTQFSRSAISQYWNGQRGAGDFPAPIARITSTNPLWDWAAVAQWLFRHGRIAEDVAVEAGILSRFNQSLEMSRSPGPGALASGFPLEA